MNNKGKLFVKITITAILGFTILLIYIILSSGNSSADHDKIVRERFKEIALSIPELKGISCPSDLCTNVVYMDFVSLPEDIETIVRGNAVTFSNFNMKQGRGSHVTLAGVLNGKLLIECDASNARVVECRQ